MLEKNSAGQSFIARILRPLKTAIVCIVLLSFLINVLMLTGPLFMLQVYDRVLASASLPTLVVLGSLTLFLYVFMGGLDIIRSRILTRIGLLIDAKASRLSYEVSIQAPLLLGDKGEDLRPLQDVENLRQFMCSAGPAAILDAPWLPFYLGIIFLFHPWLGVVALAGTLIICIFIGLNEFASRRPTIELAKENGQRALAAEAARNNAIVVYSMGMMPALQQRWGQLNNEYYTKQCTASDTSVLYSTAIKTFRFILQSSILGTGAWLAIQQEITPGVMIAASILSSRALAPVEQAISQWRGFITARNSYKKLNDIFKAKPDRDLLALPLPCNHLQISQFSCTPAGVNQAVINNISLHLRAGDGLGIIGPSGSGKSTLARGIIGVLPVLKGCVRFDGAEITQWPMEDIGNFIGYLPQDIQFFDGTISENISRFSLNPDSEDIIEAAKIAGVHDLIVTFSEGYNTKIRSGNTSLSGGQKQRIALARALYKQPFLIVLDEPNSNLDADGELALTQAIRTMRSKGSIVIVVAHRPSAVIAVDTLLYMKEGKAAALGPKHDVLKQVVSAASDQEVA